jgi:hypothetical protein
MSERLDQAATYAEGLAPSLPTIEPVGAALSAMARRLEASAC